MDPTLQNDTHTTELERQNCIQRAQQAMDLCVVMPSIRNPLHNTLLNAETKIQALCQVLAKPAEIDDIGDSATCCRTNANYILSLGEHIEPLRVDLMQAKDLVTGLLIMFDYFLAATKQLPQDMSSVGGKLQDCAVRWNAREDEAQFITAFTDNVSRHQSPITTPIVGGLSGDWMATSREYHSWLSNRQQHNECHDL